MSLKGSKTESNPCNILLRGIRIVIGSGARVAIGGVTDQKARFLYSSTKTGNTLEIKDRYRHTYQL